MTRRLRFAPAAERDLVGVLAYIARDKPGAATRFVIKLREYCEPLAEQPFIGEDCSHLRPRTRRITFRGYLIFYRVDDATVEVVRVIHGARDWESLFE